MFSRNYLGVHTPQDVFTALLISLLSLFGTAKLFSYLEKNPEKEDWLLLSAFVFCSLALVYITFKPYPMDYTTEGKLLVDPQKMMNDGYGDLGKMLGFCIARFVEKKWIKFTPLKNGWKGAVLCIVGLIPMILLKRYFSPFMEEAFALLATSCASTKASGSMESQATVAKIKECGVLLVGTTGDYRPLSYREDTGEYWGFGIEVAQRIAKELGVDIAFVPTSWPTLSSDVLSEPQAFDFALGGITITAKRLETMDMSEGYLANGKTILCRKEDAQKFRSLSELDKSDVLVMVNPGGLNEKFAYENLKNAKIIVHNRNEEIPSLVAEGKADIMITEITEAPWYVQNDTRLSAPRLARKICFDVCL